MSWLGDVLGFEKFNLGGIKDKLTDDKGWLRVLVGAIDPASTKVWNKVLGQDWEPMVNQWGGASSDTYDKANAAGINTGPGKSMHQLAQAIAGTIAGGYGASQLGGLFGSGGGAGSGGLQTLGEGSVAPLSSAPTISEPTNPMWGKGVQLLGQGMKMMPQQQQQRQASYDELLRIQQEEEARRTKALLEALQQGRGGVGNNPDSLFG